MNLKAIATGTVLAVTLPIMSMAATLNPSNNLSDQPLQFNETYDIGTVGQTLEFEIVNDTAFEQVFSTAQGTVNQTAAFFNSTGVVLTWLDSGDSDTVAGMDGAIDLLGPIFSETISAGSSAFLRLTFGDVFDGSSINGGTTPSAQIDFTVTATPVPVPAGLLLMGTALAGFGVMRRRKKAS